MHSFQVAQKLPAMKALVQFRVQLRICLQMQQTGLIGRKPPAQVEGGVCESNVIGAFL